MVTKEKKLTPWIKKRHMVVRNLLYWPLYLYTVLRYRIEIQRLPKDQAQPCFVLFNHQTAFDQFFVSFTFPQHVYYVASEDLFAKGWLSRLITWLVAPIPFRKSTADITAIKNLLRIAREGGTVAMAPEGNRTYSGTTEYMKSSVASLVKRLRLPLVLYRIEGGYGVHPRWSDVIRKGKMRSYISRTIQPEEYKEMSDAELFEIIRQELYVDDRNMEFHYDSRRKAEYLDRAMYVCPFCGLSEFYSKGDIISCKSCGRQIRYLPNLELLGIGFDFPYRNVKQWYDAQCDFIRNLDLQPYQEKPIYADTVRYSRDLYCEKKVLLDKRATLMIFADRFVVKTNGGEDIYPFSEMIGATVLGKNKLNLYLDGLTYQFKGDKHFNALKYLNLYCYACNVAKGDPQNEFLGL